ncbi:MAG: DUF4430 domain-containing protein [Clostridiaceae bacterium]|nr:DUF4430 domain-containing protein [Clostridiaceae bacterium]
MNKRTGMATPRRVPVRMAAVLTAAVVLSLLSAAGCAPAAPSGHTTAADTQVTTVSQPGAIGSSTTVTQGSLPTTGTALTSSYTGSVPTPAVVPTTGTVTPSGPAETTGTTSPSTPAATSSATATRPVETVATSVTLSVVCHTAVARVRDGAVPPDGLELPPDGIILAPVQVSLRPDDTALTVLVRAVAAANPRYGADNVLVKGGNYIEGIGNDAMPLPLYEKDFGSESGWLYYIDGTYVSVGASTRTLQPGETVVWQYTCASGRDLE